eukprot:Hpha_TRINITY_DN11474_c0_g2::TRINITY_DN11474_c0_g2_i1::g.137361::m.137361
MAADSESATPTFHRDPSMVPSTISTSGTASPSTPATGSPGSSLPKKPKFRPPKVVLRKTPPPAPAAKQSGPVITASGAWVLGDGTPNMIRIGTGGVQRENTASGLVSTPTVMSESGLGSSLFGERTVRFENLRAVKELGRGATATVTLQEDRTTGRRYAVKTMHVGTDAETTRAVEAEVKRVFGDPCAQVVETVNAFMRGPSLHVVQEFMDAGALDSIVEKCRQQSIDIPEVVASKIAEQLLLGLAEMHKKKHRDNEGKERSQVHRDLKPANVLLNLRGYCKIADFGITSDLATMGQKTVVGTFTYMAPERLKAQPYGLPSDVWAVGLIVNEVLLGKYPFRSQGGPLGILQQVTGGRPELPVDKGEAAVEFVQALLQQEAGARPTAEAALALRFIAQHSDKNGQEVIAKWLREDLGMGCDSPDAFDGIARTTTEVQEVGATEARSGTNPQAGAVKEADAVQPTLDPCATPQEASQSAPQPGGGDREEGGAATVPPNIVGSAETADVVAAAAGGPLGTQEAAAK